MTHYQFTTDEQIYLVWFGKYRIKFNEPLHKIAVRPSQKNWHEREIYFAEQCVSEVQRRTIDAGFGTTSHDIHMTLPEDHIFSFNATVREWLLLRLGKEIPRLEKRMLAILHGAKIKKFTSTAASSVGLRTIDKLCQAVYGFTPPESGTTSYTIYDLIDEWDWQRLRSCIEILHAKLARPIEQFWPVAGHDATPMRHGLIQDALGNWIRGHPREGINYPLWCIAPIAWV